MSLLSMSACLWAFVATAMASKPNEIVFKPAASPFTIVDYDSSKELPLSVSYPTTDTVICSMTTGSDSRTCGGIFEMDWSSSNGAVIFRIDAPSGTEISVDRPLDDHAEIIIEFRATNPACTDEEREMGHEGDEVFQNSVTPQILGSDVEGMTSTSTVVELGLCEIYTQLKFTAPPFAITDAGENLRIRTVSWEVKVEDATELGRAGTQQYKYKTSTEMWLRTSEALRPHLIDGVPCLNNDCSPMGQT